MKYKVKKYRIKFKLDPIYKYQLKHEILEWIKINSFAFISVILMSVIFLFSSQTGSESLTVSTNLENICKNIFGLNYLVHIFNIRKLAHFTLFGLLGTSIFTFIRHKYYYAYKYEYYLIAFVLTAIYAFTDELHQLYVFERGGTIDDVLIDCAGCLFALLINFIVITILEKRDEKLMQQALINIHKN